MEIGKIIMWKNGIDKFKGKTNRDIGKMGNCLLRKRRYNIGGEHFGAQFTMGFGIF